MPLAGDAAPTSEAELEHIFAPLPAGAAGRTLKVSRHELTCPSETATGEQRSQTCCCGIYFNWHEFPSPSVADRQKRLGDIEAVCLYVVQQLESHVSAPDNLRR
jgi:hypothetical protein